MTILVEKHRF